MGETISRAEAVSLLWKLKQASDRTSSSEIPYIHFNMLLIDPDYRAEILATAMNSNFEDLRDIAAKLSGSDLEGRLIKDPAKVEVSKLTPHQTHVRFGDDIDSADKRVVHHKPSFASITIAVMLFLAGGIGAGAFYYKEVIGFVSAEYSVNQPILSNTHWREGNTYLLEDIIYVDGGARLTIDPGVIIKGKPGSALVITRESQLFARGTRTKPIVFTSASEKNQRQPGDWGGVVLLGSAPVNELDAHIEGVDITDYRGMFGGVNETDSCGVLEYVRIEYAGYEVYANNELNGLTMGGCGSHTVVRNVQVHLALDDGVEVFGGSVDMKNILITGPGDDGLDWDKGWTGRVQFLIVQQHADRGDNAFEGDSNKKRPSSLPKSEPTIYNATLIGGFSKNKSQRAMTLRRGTGGHFSNFLILGFSNESIDIRDASTVENIDQGLMSFDSFMMFDIGANGRTYFSSEEGEANDDDDGFNEQAYFSKLSTIRTDISPGFGLAVRSPIKPNFSPKANSTAKLFAVAPPQGEMWNEGAKFIGALPPNATQTWLDGWTKFPGY